MVVFYDGSFEGFLTLVYEVYYAKLHVSAIIKKMPERLVFESVHEVFSDDVKASKVLNALKKHFSKENQRTIFNIFLCDTKAHERSLLEYIRTGFKNTRLLGNITNPHLFYIQNLEKELLSLVHKMYGFTRFEELEDGTLYAKIETKFNILPFLGEHFFKRLGKIPFIIHDVRRSLALMKDESSMQIHSIASFDAPIYSQNEAHVKELWKRFFKATAIQSRHNPKLQKNLVPLLYRTYMSEFQA
ncbi:TIGR03915 family putative DNA repair protein [Sulfurospirillum barnesii]|uniref:Putative DNA metabolism protein n=1 Tax=Sulfurospirillum barnesii (strain ATCC 700032 / DSM 10660 / SES-3) TaxID=760154 RepID=I3XWS7_SULBS|nr:TIGR03915 family putative DNA repair protein [Sulfurospirillum barnesii]AFL68401.1 putative DNA metabolism protein [Sulfurospirillum barnesii SES-3]